jgi:hypothetical protein
VLGAFYRRRTDRRDVGEAINGRRWSLISDGFGNQAGEELMRHQTSAGEVEMVVDALIRLRPSEGGWPSTSYRKMFLNLDKGFGFKSKDSNTFKPNLSWSQTNINVNNFFEYFSNLELFKIDSNIQIQTKALNGGLLK